MKREKFYPFDDSLTARLKKLRVYGKAKKAYDSVPEKDKELKDKCDALDCCFIFSLAEEGTDYWYRVHSELERLKVTP